MESSGVPGTAALLSKAGKEHWIVCQCIFTTWEEQQRFRQMIVNAVMAADIADKELQARRKDRLDVAFQTKGSSNSVAEDDSSSHIRDRKATIVLEYIIQASDVAHCMQHWLTYQKFNRRLFEERYLAWLKSWSNEGGKHCC
jgi:3'5'-cyclic nucleotide phosphodiesterase